MRKYWLLLAVGLLATMLAISAVACGDDEDEDGGAPTATEEEGLTPEATEPAAEEATTAPAATLIVSEHSELGSILTDAAGRTLYTFANDEPGVSTCDEACAGLWPPLTITTGEPTAGEGVPGELATIERPDGSRQVTYNGIPLHYFSNDTAPGDANGNGFANLWSVIEVGD